MDQDATWYGPEGIVLDGGPSSPLNGGTSPTFRPMSIVAKWSPISATAEHLFYGLEACATYTQRFFSGTSDR